MEFRSNLIVCSYVYSVHQGEFNNISQSNTFREQEFAQSFTDTKIENCKTQFGKKDESEASPFLSNFKGVLPNHN